MRLTALPSLSPTPDQDQAWPHELSIQVLELAPDAVVLSDAHHRVLLFNAAAEALWNQPRQQVLGRSAEALVPQELLRLHGHHAGPLDFLIERADGQRRWTSLSVSCVTLADQRLQLAFLRDTTAQHARQPGPPGFAQLADSSGSELQYKVLDAMAHDAPLADIARLLCREVEHIAPGLLASLCQADALGRLRILAAPGMTREMQALLEGQPLGPHTSGWSACSNGLLTHGLRACWSSPIKAAHGAVLGSFALHYRDLQRPSPQHERLMDMVLHLGALLLERERERARIHRLAHFDALTGLANRHLLLSQTQLLLQANQQAHASLALVLVDLDHFKEVNDSWGHKTGDRILRILAARLKEGMPGDAVVARLGGDEFVIVLPSCPPHQAALSAQQLLAAIGRPLPVQGTQVLQPSASLGIALFPEDGTDVESLLHHADLARHQAKTHGRRGYCFYREQMNTLVQERSRLAADLRAALREGGLQLHYQPQVRNLDAAHPLCGVEALSRWEHPELGAISPVRFIALAEELGLMDRLSEWVVHEACRQLSVWRRQALAIPHVSINLSASNLRNGRLPLQIASQLRQHGLRPSDLRIEVTETTVLEHHPMVLATARALHDHGVLLSLDDFGTGYSSLAALQHLPISVLKLDKSFIQDIAHRRSARTLTEAVLHIGQRLGLEVVAEGVENEDQRALLQQLGCPVVQGYLFARPMPPARLDDWMAQRG